VVSRRQEKVAQTLKQEISHVILRELHDPRISFLTIMKVETTPDLRIAKVYVSVMGDEVKQTLTLKGLRNAAPFIRQAIGHRVRLRHTPALRFQLDDSVKKSIHLSKLIREALADSGGHDEASD